MDGDDLTSHLADGRCAPARDELRNGESLG